MRELCDGLWWTSPIWSQNFNIVKIELVGEQREERRNQEMKYGNEMRQTNEKRDCIKMKYNCGGQRDSYNNHSQGCWAYRWVWIKGFCLLDEPAFKSHGVLQHK